MTRMLVQQHRLQVRSFGTDPCSLEGKELAEWVRYNYVALIKELGEALDEIQWKPWATGDFFRRDLYLKEMVDAWHFFQNLLLPCVPRNGVGSGTINELAAEFFLRYIHKNEINANRQAAGYDGVSNKCSCGRALEDLPRAELGRIGVDLQFAQGRICPCGRWHPDAA